MSAACCNLPELWSKVIANGTSRYTVQTLMHVAVALMSGVKFLRGMIRVCESNTLGQLRVSRLKQAL